MAVDLDDPIMDGYQPLAEFVVGDHDHSSTRIRDIPPGKPRYSLTVFPLELAFANTLVGEQSPAQTVLLTNSGYENLIIAGFEPVGPFVVVGQVPTKILPGEVASVQVAFKPTVASPATGGLYIKTGNAAGHEFVELSGTSIGHGSGVISELPTFSEAADWITASAPDFVRLAGFTSVGDGGGGIYKHVAAEPAHEGKFSVALTGGGTVWYEIDEKVLDPRMFGAVIGSANQAAAFAKLASHPAKHWTLPAGVSWRIDSDITVNHDLTIEGFGATLDFSQGNGQLIIQGALVQIADLSANVTMRAKTISLSSSAGVSKNSVLVLYNPTDYSWSGHRSYYREGEMVRVHSIDGNVLSIFGETADPYVAANLDVYRMDGVSVNISGVRVLPNLVLSKPAIQLRYCTDVTISGLRGSGGVYTILALDRCYNVAINACSLQNSSPAVDDEYGITVSNCQNVVISGSTLSASRHAIALGGGTGPGCVPTRNVRVIGCILTALLTTGAGAADMHGCLDNISYEGCILSHANMAGRNVSFINCTITASQHVTDGPVIYGSEIVGGVYRIKDCILTSDGNAINFGYVHLVALGPGSQAGREGLRNDWNVEIDGIILDVAGGATARPFWIVNRSTTKKMNVRVGSVRVIRATALQCILRSWDDVNATLLSDYLIVDGPITAPAGTTLLLAHASTNAVPKRMMPQRIAADLSILNASSIATTLLLTFRYPYPKTPDVSGVGVASIDGTPKTSFGGRAAVPYIYTRAATNIRLGLLPTGGNFTADDTVRISGNVSIDEI